MLTHNERREWRHSREGEAYSTRGIYTKNENIERAYSLRKPEDATIRITAAVNFLHVL